MTTKSDIAAAVADKTGSSKAAALEAIDAALDHIASTLAGGERVHLGGFGIFSVKPTKARKGRNPSTGEPVDIPAGRALKFKPAAELKGRI
ncbi:HU family DNA-binding protein [Mesorhizobium silamurunense]|uniref:HU family DNA-binding protein n=1 Tax=Mesorhizobium silamurunense TaxID=499528 RepID=UPI001784CB93|nr:HU family DNA-binding protein [Mesorhizobium silamurunense]